MNLYEKKQKLKDLQIEERIIEIDIAINSKKREILNNEVKMIDDHVFLNENFSEEEYNEIIERIDSKEITNEYIEKLIDNVTKGSYKDEEGYNVYDFETDEDYIIYLSFCTGLNKIRNKELEEDIAKLKKERMKLVSLEELVVNDT